ncbi:major capsid protein [Tortoise microvirus 22]|nr:major capsid protein [Tortoise microvirus 22]
MPKVEVHKPSRSTQNLSFINRTSIAPGVLVPVMVKECLPGDTWSISIDSLMKTLPLNGPLMGSFKVQFDTYFCPVRFYNASLHDDQYSFDPDTVYFPHIRVQQRGLDQEDLSVEKYAGICPSSLLHHLGLPRWILPPKDTGSVSRYVNACPVLAYYEIFRNYYANTQEPNFYYVNGFQDIAGSPYRIGVSSSPLILIDQTRSDILRYSATTPNNSIQVPANGPYNFSGDIHHVPLGGLALRTYLPDMFSVWISEDRYEDTLSSALVDTTSGSFNMDALRLANKINKMLQKTLIAGGRYSDWQYVQYGQSLRRVVEVPSFVHSTSYELVFEDVVQTSDSGSDDNPLGSLGARGVGSGFGRRFRHHCPEHGFLITVCSVIPRVDYYQGTKHYFNHQRLSDVHIPALDGVGFQDLLVDSLNSSDNGQTANGWAPLADAVGKQPAWTEYMTAVNEVHGDFAEENKLMYLTLARQFVNDPFEVLNDYTAYIKPDYYNYAFADASLTAQNFWLQIKFSVFVKRAISKRVMPNL